MTSTGHRTDRDHTILAALSEIEAELDAVQHAPAWSLSDEETRQAVVRATRLAARVAALEMKVAAQADRARVGDASGATSAGVWWANQTRMTQRDAHRKMKLAKALERHEAVGEALAAGDLLVEQAQVIIDAVDALPEDVDPDIKTQARPARNLAHRVWGLPNRCEGTRLLQRGSRHERALVPGRHTHRASGNTVRTTS